MTMMLEKIGGDVHVLAEELLEARKKPGIQGLLTGIKQLDEILRGIKPRTYGIVSGRTGMGKTSLALCFARNMEAAGKRVGFLTLEMPRRQLQLRLIAAIAGVSQQGIQEGWTRPEDYSEALEVLRDMDMIVNTVALYDANAVQKTVFKMAEECEVIFIDYLQLIKTQASTRTVQLDLVSKTIMECALRTGVPMVGLCQLNRDAAGITPGLHNLKGSGSFEEDAAYVIAIHQPDMQPIPGDPHPQEVDASQYELHVLKNRFGPVGQCDVRFDKPTMVFK